MKNVTCYGTGVIGSAWAAVFLKGGCEVTLYDISEEMLTSAKEKLAGTMQFFVSTEQITQEEAACFLEKARYTTDPEDAVKDAEYVQENCPERLELKKEIIRTIESYCSETTIIASSSSGLMPTLIAQGAVHPERILVGHPYNPVYMIPLVEICRGEKTSDETVQAAKALYEAVGKEVAVLNKEVPGYICNRIQAVVVRECFNLVYRGVCSVEDMDKAVVYSVAPRWAIIGPALVNQLGGGAGGFRAMMQNLGPAVMYWWKDIDKYAMSEFPDEFVDMAEKGIAEEMANREPGTGQTDAELADYMNRGVLAILKYHGKI